MGLQEITALRLAGRSVDEVIVIDEPMPVGAMVGLPAWVNVHGQDPAAMDWRPVIGLRVIASSPCPERAKKLFDLCCDNRALQVVAMHQPTNFKDRTKNDWIRFSEFPHPARDD